MASVQAHAVVERILPLLSLLVSRVGDPSIRLQQDGWAEVLLTVPPVRRAGSRAASAENALVESVELLAVFLALSEFSAVGCRLGLLEVGLDGFVLLVELREVRHEVLDHVGMWERIDAGFLCCFSRDTTYHHHKSVHIQTITGGKAAGAGTYTNKQAY